MRQLRKTGQLLHEMADALVRVPGVVVVVLIAIWAGLRLKSAHQARGGRGLSPAPG